MGDTDLCAPPYFDVVINLETFVADAGVALNDLRPEWMANDISTKMFTEGCINTLIGCFTDDNLDDMIMFRIFQSRDDLLIDRKAELKNAQMLSSKGLAPKVLGIFKNGFCYEFLTGKCLNIDTILEPNAWRLVAEAFAKLHFVCYENCPTSPFKWHSFIKEHIVSFPHSVIQQVSSVFPEHIISKQKLLEDAELIEVAMKKVNSPIVFCHGDPTPLNLILNKSQDSVMFIDFEFSDFGYQAFDIAFHFCEFAGLKDPDFTRYPSREFQLEWLRVYTDAWFFKVDGRSATKDDVELLYRQVNSLVPAVHFTAAVVTVAMGTAMQLPLKYAADRFKEYFKTRAQLLRPS